MSDRTGPYRTNAAPSRGPAISEAAPVPWWHLLRNFRAKTAREQAEHDGYASAQPYPYEAQMRHILVAWDSPRQTPCSCGSCRVMQRSWLIRLGRWTQPRRREVHFLLERGAGPFKRRVTFSGQRAPSGGPGYQAEGTVQ